MTLLEKRWLKSVVSDSRLKLFCEDCDNLLTDEKPLFNAEDFIVIGQYNNGDNYDDEDYKRNFRTIIKAIKEGWGVKLISENRYGEVSPEPYVFIPEHIEYSEIEDKLSAHGYSPNKYGDSIIRIDRIKKCELCEKQERIINKNAEIRSIIFLLDGETARTQNALERILIEFSHYNKRVRETERGDYRIEMEYVLAEERELLVLRLMPFAQYIRVLSPSSIKNEIKNRIIKQQRLLRLFPNNN